jgi:photosystem II stability/assembly factor-like uncharacterized protein
MVNQIRSTMNNLGFFSPNTIKILCFGVFLLFLMSCTTPEKQWEVISTNILDGLHDIEIISDNEVVAYSYGTGKVYKSWDEGETWKEIYRFDSIYFEQIQFLDQKSGWIVGSPNKIFLTTDGGNSWELKKLPDTYADAWIYGMTFMDVDNGYVTAITRDSIGWITTIFETINRGNSWEPVNEVNGMLLNLELLNNTLYASGHNVIIKNPEKITWEYIYLDTTYKTGQIRDLEYGFDDKLIAVSFNGFVLQIDSNETIINRITQNRLRGLISVNEKEWIAVGDTNKQPGNFFVSWDKGSSWQLSGAQYPDIHRIAKSDKHLYIVGKDGFIGIRDK